MTLKLEQIHENVVAKIKQLDSEVTETLTSQVRQYGLWYIIKTIDT